MAEQMTFEAAMEQLEKIVTGLEAGNLTLDESLKLYEQGVKLASFCEEQLKNAQLHVVELKPEGQSNE